MSREYCRVCPYPLPREKSEDCVFLSRNKVHCYKQDLDKAPRFLVVGRSSVRGCQVTCIGIMLSVYPLAGDIGLVLESIIIAPSDPWLHLNKYEVLEKNTRRISPQYILSGRHIRSIGPRTVGGFHVIFSRLSMISIVDNSLEVFR